MAVVSTEVELVGDRAQRAGWVTALVVAGVLVVDAGARRRSERSDDSDPQAAKAAAPARTSAPTAAAMNANRREVTGGSVPYRMRGETAREIRRV